MEILFEYYEKLVQKEICEIIDVLINETLISRHSRKKRINGEFYDLYIKHINRKCPLNDKAFIKEKFKEVEVAKKGFHGLILKTLIMIADALTGTYIDIMIDENRTSNVVRARHINCLKRLKKFLENDNEKPFVEFDVLDEIFELVFITDREKEKILADIIKVNLTKDFNSIMPDYTKIKGHKFKHIEEQRLDNLIERREIDELMYENDKLTKLIFKKSSKELKEFISNNPLNLEEFRDKMTHMDELLNKTINTEEVEELINIFESLGIKSLSRYERNKSKKQQKKEEQFVIHDYSNFKREENKDDISSKEKKKIYNQISKYFDLDKMCPTRILNIDEIYYVVSLLYKVNAQEYLIDDIIEICERMLKSNGLIEFYSTLSDKFIMIEDNSIKNIKTEIDELLIDMSSLEAFSKDYLEYKTLVEEYIKELLKLIGNNYNYEKEQSMKLTYA